MTTLVFLLEEPSAREMLQALLPKLLMDTAAYDIRYIVFQGKQDMDKRIEKRIRFWCIPGSYFVVLRDQDSGDCLEIKSHLKARAQSAGRPDALIRIACRELESFYLGDLNAVQKGLEISNLASKQQKAKYRDPDRLNNAKEELIKLTGREYQEISGSRAIGRHLNTDNNCSKSFNVLVHGLRNLVDKV